MKLLYFKVEGDMSIIIDWLDNPLDLSNPITFILVILFFYVTYLKWKSYCEGYAKMGKNKIKKKKK